MRHYAPIYPVGRYEVVSKLKRMVFYNPETGKYYHGYGREIRIHFEGPFTEPSDCKKYDKNF